MAAEYKLASPYYGTPRWGQFMDIWKGVVIPKDVTDARYQIDPPYNLRPDLLAYDMYQDANLWWVFAVRNPDVIRDPVFDFVAPTVIYVPSLAVVKTAVGF
jgi:hypothetical protein